MVDRPTHIGVDTYARDTPLLNDFPLSSGDWNPTLRTRRIIALRVSSLMPIRWPRLHPRASRTSRVEDAMDGRKNAIGFFLNARLVCKPMLNVASRRQEQKLVFFRFRV